jgi:hypothetical protein
MQHESGKRSCNSIHGRYELRDLALDDGGRPTWLWLIYEAFLRQPPRCSHGSPRTCTGGCPAHIHASWVSACYGSGALAAPCAWVMAFPVPRDGNAENDAEAEHEANAAPVAALGGDVPGHV